MADSLTLTIPTELDGERIDKALAAILQISRTGARTLINRGVDLDGSPAKASDRVLAGSTVVAPEPDQPGWFEPEDVPFGVVHEDPSVIVVNKPPGLVVHPGSENTTGTLAAGLLYRYPDLEGVGTEGRWGLIHRLDRDTSGVLLVARTNEAYDFLTGQLAERKISRIYLALVQGTFGIPTGTIEAPIGRDPLRPMRRTVIATGKEATTHYEVIAEYESEDVSFVEVRLETGRTHQIRVHMKAIEHAVVGDGLYSSKPSRVMAPRAFLHASRLSFLHPDSGEQVEVGAPLPEDLQNVLDKVAG